MLRLCCHRRRYKNGKIHHLRIVQRKGVKSHGESLPNDNNTPKYFADPTHRAKYLAGTFVEMTKGAKSVTKADKLDALRMKKYYSYFVEQNCKKDMEWLMEYIMTPLDHLFYDHHLCDST